MSKRGIPISHSFLFGFLFGINPQWVPSKNEPPIWYPRQAILQPKVGRSGRKLRIQGVQSLWTSEVEFVVPAGSMYKLLPLEIDLRGTTGRLRRLSTYLSQRFGWSLPSDSVYLVSFVRGLNHPIEEPRRTPRRVPYKGN